MEFTFHNSYVILELVLSTVIFWTELNCWRKSYSNNAILLLSWSHRYKNSSVVISKCGWPLRNIHISNDNGCFTFYVDALFPLCQDFNRTWLYIWVERQVSYKKQDLLTLLEHLSSPLFFVWLGLCCSSFLFVLSYYVSLCSEFRVMTSVTISA